MKEETALLNPVFKAAPSNIMGIALSKPSAADGFGVSQLIGRCPPLDTNSTYCNLLQCHHFSETCVIAKKDEEVVGFISAYLRPDRPTTLFVWQVAVDQQVRGQGLAQRMLTNLFSRPLLKDVQFLETTITPDNLASEYLFRRFAQHLDVPIKKSVQYERIAHFGGQHGEEILHRLGPIQNIHK